MFFSKLSKWRLAATKAKTRGKTMRGPPRLQWYISGSHINVRNEKALKLGSTISTINLMLKQSPPSKIFWILWHSTVLHNRRHKYLKNPPAENICCLGMRLQTYSRIEVAEKFARSGTCQLHDSESIPPSFKIFWIKFLVSFWQTKNGPEYWKITNPLKNFRGVLSMPRLAKHNSRNRSPHKFQPGLVCACSSMNGVCERIGVHSWSKKIVA